MANSFAAWIGAHRIGEWHVHEKERAYQRFVVCSVIAVSDFVHNGPVAGGLPLWVLLGGSAYGIASLLYAFTLSTPHRLHVGFLYGFLLADPVFLMLAIASDPDTFVFLIPLVLLINTGPGMRYGTRALHLTLGLSAVTAGAVILMGSFWKRELQWTASLLLSIALVPVLFNTQIRRIHSVRKLEEDRARLLVSREAVAARASFLSKVSHELRSPLQSIVSALDVFELRHLNAARGDAELISRMRRASLLLNTQLRDLLTLAKGEAGRLDLRPETVEGGELVRALAEAARPLAEARSLQLQVEVPAQPTFVVVDGSRIDQILTNLIVNSIRFTDQGTVRAILHPYEPREGLLRFTVADTGRGIPEDELPTLLLPEQKGATKIRRGEGSGIGLAIVRTLVSHLGGRISVSSRLGVGTTFDVEIPATPVVTNDATAIEPTLNERVLVVDDRSDVLDAIVGVLDEIGVPCDRAADGVQALQLVNSTQFTAALLDLELRDESGEELARSIRVASIGKHHIRLIAMTAGAHEREARTITSSFDGWLVKPVDSHALRRVLHGATRNSVPGAAGAP